MPTDEMDVFQAWANTRQMLEGAGVDTSRWTVDRHIVKTAEGRNSYRWMLSRYVGSVIHPVEELLDLGHTHRAAVTAIGVFYAGFRFGLNHTTGPTDDLRRQQIFASRMSRALEREWRDWSERATDLGIQREKLGEDPNIPPVEMNQDRNEERGYV